MAREPKDPNVRALRQGADTAVFKVALTQSVQDISEEFEQFHNGLKPENGAANCNGSTLAALLQYRQSIEGTLEALRKLSRFGAGAVPRELMDNFVDTIPPLMRAGGSLRAALPQDRTLKPDQRAPASAAFSNLEASLSRVLMTMNEQAKGTRGK